MSIAACVRFRELKVITSLLHSHVLVFNSSVPNSISREAGGIRIDVKHTHANMFILTCLNIDRRSRDARPITTGGHRRAGSGRIPVNEQVLSCRDGICQHIYRLLCRLGLRSLHRACIPGKAENDHRECHDNTDDSFPRFVHKLPPCGISLPAEPGWLARIRIRMPARTQ